MLLRWLRNRRRRRWLADPAPAAYADWLAEDLWFYRRLTPDDRRTLIDLARLLVREKAWEPRAGFTLTDRIRLSIAAQAALLLLHLERHDLYPNVERIVIFPATYEMPRRDGVVVTDTPVLGQANYRGPVVLSWRAVAGGAMHSDDGHNVVFHEFAHKLDMLDGWVDGTPPLRSREQFQRWVDVMSRCYDDLKAAASAHRRSVLDDYGATNPSGFCAVATETFFEKSDTLQRNLPELYALLADYYRQDPAAWPARG